MARSVYNVENVSPSANGQRSKQQKVSQGGKEGELIDEDDDGDRSPDTQKTEVSG